MSDVVKLKIKTGETVSFEDETQMLKLFCKKAIPRISKLLSNEIESINAINKIIQAFNGFIYILDVTIRKDGRRGDVQMCVYPSGDTVDTIEDWEFDIEANPFQQELMEDKQKRIELTMEVQRISHEFIGEGEKIIGTIETESLKKPPKKRKPRKELPEEVGIETVTGEQQKKVAKLRVLPKKGEQEEAVTKPSKRRKKETSEEITVPLIEKGQGKREVEEKSLEKIVEESREEVIEQVKRRVGRPRKKETAEEETPKMPKKTVRKKKEED